MVAGHLGVCQVEIIVLGPAYPQLSPQVDPVDLMPTHLHNQLGKDGCADQSGIVRHDALLCVEAS